MFWLQIWEWLKITTLYVLTDKLGHCNVNHTLKAVSNSHSSLPRLHFKAKISGYFASGPVPNLAAKRVCENVCRWRNRSSFLIRWAKPFLIRQISLIDHQQKEHKKIDAIYWFSENSVDGIDLNLYSMLRMILKMIREELLWTCLFSCLVVKTV